MAKTRAILYCLVRRSGFVAVGLSLDFAQSALWSTEWESGLYFYPLGLILTRSVSQGSVNLLNPARRSIGLSGDRGRSSAETGHWSRSRATRVPLSTRPLKVNLANLTLFPRCSSSYLTVSLPLT